MPNELLQCIPVSLSLLRRIESHINHNVINRPVHQEKTPHECSLPHSLDASPPTTSTNPSVLWTGMLVLILRLMTARTTILHPITKNQRRITGKRDPLLALILPVIVHEDDVERMEVARDVPKNYQSAKCPHL
jgi:hypothetical protein